MSKNEWYINNIHLVFLNRKGSISMERQINYKTMRIMVGLIAILLAPTVYWLANSSQPLTSISISYWTDAGDVFVGSLLKRELKAVDQSDNSPFKGLNNEVRNMIPIKSGVTYLMIGR